MHMIRDWMSHPVHFLKPLDTVHHARELMEKYRINQMPVVLDGEVVGIVTDRDVRDASPSVFDPEPRRKSKTHDSSDLKAIPVEGIMSAGVVLLGPGESIVEAARIMGRERFGSVPIVEAGRLIGILTRSDLLRALVALAEAGSLGTGGAPERQRS